MTTFYLVFKGWVVEKAQKYFFLVIECSCPIIIILNLGHLIKTYLVDLYTLMVGVVANVCMYTFNLQRPPPGVIIGPIIPPGRQRR